MKVWVTEYSQLAKDSSGDPAQMPVEPALAHYQIDLPDATAVLSSQDLNVLTRFVCLYGDAAFCYKVGLQTPLTDTPVTVATGKPVSSSTPEWFGIDRKNSTDLRISAIAR